MDNSKSDVQDFWNAASCGEELYLKGNDEMEAFNNQAEIRYQLEPYIKSFAGFESSGGKRVLEIGVGLGADHQQFAKAGADLYGIDLTERAIANTKKRFSLFGLKSSLSVGDAEALKFEDNFFDIVYSWGVIHHSPDTPRAVSEIFRVLKPGGEARVMIYHKKSIIGYMLWIRYALLRLKPFTSLREIYSKYLESPGTKAYTVAEAKLMFKGFTSVTANTVLTHGDLLSSAAGQRHSGLALSIARKIFPRFLIRKLLPKHGLFMLITATK
ncbi:MAG: class I SAM-dependent methyltransferase [Chitinophagaceae bacterium]|nr:class I SAM-dependent methyltransferase [Chitinophagaceae bacterium]